MINLQSPEVNYLNSCLLTYLGVSVVEDLIPGFVAVHLNPELLQMERDGVVDLLLVVGHPVDRLVQERRVAHSANLKEMDDILHELQTSSFG